MKRSILILVLTISTGVYSTLAQYDKSLLDYRFVLLGDDKNPVTVEVDSASLEWGKQVLQNLNLEHLSNFEKAQKINDFLSDYLKYNFKPRMNVSEIIKKKGGFCVSHAIMGIFLLRLAGIPAKLAHEVHITKQYTIVSLLVGRWAKKHNDGINSYWHNDHIWVWFDNDGKWEPFDSALDICGFDEFYNKRFYNHKKLSKGFAQRWTGPPFVIWERTNKGGFHMNNISYKIWNENTLTPSKKTTEWLQFIENFQGWNHKNFNKEYLPKHLLNEVKRASRKWF